MNLAFLRASWGIFLLASRLQRSPSEARPWLSELAESKLMTSLCLSSGFGQVTSFGRYFSKWPPTKIL